MRAHCDIHHHLTSIGAFEWLGAQVANHLGFFSWSFPKSLSKKVATNYEFAINETRCSVLTFDGILHQFRHRAIECAGVMRYVINTVGGKIIKIQDENSTEKNNFLM